MITKLMQVIIIGILSTGGYSCHYKTSDATYSSVVPEDSTEYTPMPNISEHKVKNNECDPEHDNPIDSAHILAKRRGWNDLYFSYYNTGRARITKISCNPEENESFEVSRSFKILEYLYEFFITKTEPIEASREYVGWRTNGGAPPIEFTFEIYRGEEKTIERVTYEIWPTQDGYQIGYSDRFNELIRYLSNFNSFLNMVTRDKYNH